MEYIDDSFLPGKLKEGEDYYMDLHGSRVLTGESKGNTNLRNT